MIVLELILFTLQGPVPERSNSFCILNSYALLTVTFCVLLHLVVKARQYFVTSSCMFLDKKTVLEIWLLNPQG